MQLSIYSIVVIACTVVSAGIIPVEAAHHSNSNSHARKSLNWRHGRSSGLRLDAAALPVGSNQKEQMVPRQAVGLGLGLGMPDLNSLLEAPNVPASGGGGISPTLSLSLTVPPLLPAEPQGPTPTAEPQGPGPLTLLSLSVGVGSSPPDTPTAPPTGPHTTSVGVGSSPPDTPTAPPTGPTPTAPPTGRPTPTKPDKPTDSPTGPPDTDTGNPTVPPDTVTAAPTVPPDTVTAEPTVPPDTVTAEPTVPSGTVTAKPTGPSGTITGVPPSSPGSISDGPLPTISFPGSSLPNSSPPGPSLPGSSISGENDTDVGTTTTDPVIATVSLQSEFTFLTENSLVFNTKTQDVPTPSATDPDALPSNDSTQLHDNTLEPTPVTALSVAPLPTGIPARIYPRDQIMPGDDLTGFTLISILFDDRLNWPFVVENQVAASQIFAYLPVVIAHSLEISVDQVKTFALQVYVPSSYHGPQDSQNLGTIWLGYIPQELVSKLAAEIKAKQSEFYTGVSDPVAKDLVSMINSGFALNSVADPNIGGHIPGDDDGSDGSGDGSEAQNGANTNSGKTRQDAIIGVVTALGTVAVLVLVFLVYRSWKRRQALKHRRLSDAPGEGGLGVRPEGRDYDQDSVGGARRRSFYFAEDSLRDQQFREQVPADPHNPFADPVHGERTSPMMTRRNVIPAAISAPVLKESSMNW